MRHIGALFAASTIAVAAMLPAFAADISGAGATFPYPVYAKWAGAYKKETGNAVNYQSIGSGGGIKQITAQTVTFGASDMPLKPEQLEKEGLLQFPMVMGGVVPIINVEGVKENDVVLDGATLADIFLGKIKSWDDLAIKKLNANVQLPSQPIVVVHRSDGSGTTFLFTDYLSKVSADWKKTVGANTAVEWPVGIGAKGNEGVANNVAQAKGSIGYVEFAYVKQNKLSNAKLINKDGKIVAPTTDSFKAAAVNANWDGTPGFGVVLTNESGPESWPLVGATFILMHKQSHDVNARREALKFFDWAYTKGDKLAEELDYIPMPDKVVDSVKRVWLLQVKDKDGKPVLALP